MEPFLRARLLVGCKFEGLKGPLNNYDDRYMCGLHTSRAPEVFKYAVSVAHEVQINRDFVKVFQA